ncbi:TPA: hypothetical protein DCZ39_03995 [Patescibacteria group bacterium]|nr:hypothetical protein [Candidatus Gracilibacteria bacterium]
MKKIVVSISMLIVIFGCTASAEVSERSGDVVTLTPNISEKSVSDINQIGMKFCNDGLIAEKLTSQLHMQLQPGKRQEICTVFYSRFTSGTVKIDF